VGCRPSPTIHARVPQDDAATVTPTSGIPQGGIVAPRGGQTIHIKTQVHLHGVTIRSDQDIKTLADAIARHYESINRTRRP
jgi:hypothetical protein